MSMQLYQKEPLMASQHPATFGRHSHYDSGHTILLSLPILLRA